MPEENSNEEPKMKHYSQSPNMIHGRIHCCGTERDLASMDIDRRWEMDNRIPTWNFGMVNFGFDQNFLQNGGSICATDDEVIKVIDKNQPESKENVATRQIRFNGQGFIFVPKK